jgi:hypothetical protein
MSTLQISIAEQKAISINKIKKQYPGEWVLIGNPEMDDDFLNVISGIPVLHSKDKKEVCYLDRDKVANYQTFTLIFTGIVKPARKIVSLYSSSIK